MASNQCTFQQKSNYFFERKNEKGFSNKRLKNLKGWKKLILELLTILNPFEDLH